MYIFNVNIFEVVKRCAYNFLMFVFAFPLYIKFTDTTFFIIIIFIIIIIFKIVIFLGAKLKGEVRTRITNEWP
jgi:hypothetical protein